MAFHDDVPDHEAFMSEILARTKKFLTVLRHGNVGPVGEVLGHSGFRGAVDDEKLPS